MRWALPALLLALGCAEARLPRVPGDPPPALSDLSAERGYQAVLEQATRTAAIYDLLDAKAFLGATWQTPAFAEARVRREGAFKLWPPELLATRLEAERQRLEGVTEFFLGVQVNEPRFDDFGRPHSIWRLALEVDGGAQLEPLSIERLGRTSVELRSSYSFLESFWVGYRVRFPAVTPRPGQRLTLHLASAVGAAHLVYLVE
jgi:hypothetical protein